MNTPDRHAHDLPNEQPRQDANLNARASPDGHRDDTQRSLARQALEREVSARERRKLQARQEQYRTVWFGLGTFGLVGWSVTIPSLLGIALGLWIDARWPSRFSWTLMLLFLGVALGCLNAWRWINQESPENQEVRPKKSQQNEASRDDSSRSP